MSEESLPESIEEFVSAQPVAIDVDALFSTPPDALTAETATMIISELRRKRLELIEGKKSGEDGPKPKTKRGPKPKSSGGSLSMDDLINASPEA